MRADSSESRSDRTSGVDIHEDYPVIRKEGQTTEEGADGKRRRMQTNTSFSAIVPRREAGHKRKGERAMEDTEKDIGLKLAEAFDALPEGKKEYLLGYAEGVASMKARAMEKKEEEKSA